MERILIGRWFLLIVTLCLCACEEPEDKKVQAEITHFSVWDQRAVNHELHVDNVNNIISNKQDIPTYVNLFRLIAEFKLNNPDAVLKVNDKIQRSGQGENDFSGEMMYDIFVEDKKQKSYTVKIPRKDCLIIFVHLLSPENRWSHINPPSTMKPAKFRMRMKYR